MPRITVLIRPGRATWDKSIVYARGVDRFNSPHNTTICHLQAAGSIAGRDRHYSYDWLPRCFRSPPDFHLAAAFGRIIKGKSCDAVSFPDANQRLFPGPAIDARKFWCLPRQDFARANGAAAGDPLGRGPPKPTLVYGSLTKTDGGLTRRARDGSQLRQSAQMHVASLQP